MTVRPLDRQALTALVRTVEPARLGTLAIACFAMFALSVLLMPAISPGYDPVRQTISEGVLEPHGDVQTAGLAMLAIGAFALAAAMWRNCVDRWDYGTAALIASSAGFVVLLAIFHADPGNAARSTSGWIHNFSASAAYFFITLAMIWACVPLRSRAWRSSALMAVFPLLMILLAVFLTDSIGPRGLVQRLSVGCELLWLLLMTELFVLRERRDEAPAVVGDACDP